MYGHEPRFYCHGHDYEKPFASRPSADKRLHRSRASYSGFRAPRSLGPALRRTGIDPGRRVRDWIVVPFRARNIVVAAAYRRRIRFAVHTDGVLSPRWRPPADLHLRQVERVGLSNTRQSGRRLELRMVAAQTLAPPR